MDQDTEKTMYNNADKFIELANEMSQSENIGAIGLAFRYAAARYTAFEASTLTNNLAEDKDKHLQFYADTFTEMLQKNFEEYINIQTKNKTS